MEKEKKILLDRDGYDKLVQEIEKLKEELKNITAGRKDAFDAGAGDGWDSPEFEEIERQERRIAGEIQRRYEEIKRVEIIEHKKNDDLINVGDIVNINLYFAPDDYDNMTFKLVSSLDTNKSEIQEISINSPLGEAIYQKQVGDECKYKVGENEFTAIINSKNIDEEKVKKI